MPEYHRLDVTLAKEFVFGKASGELMIGVTDIFNQTEQQVSSEAHTFINHETPGRTFFGRLQLRF